MTEEGTSRSLCLPVYMSVCLLIHRFVSPFVCLSVCLIIFLSACPGSPCLLCLSIIRYTTRPATSKRQKREKKLEKDKTIEVEILQLSVDKSFHIPESTARLSPPSTTAIPCTAIPPPYHHRHTLPPYEHYCLQWPLYCVRVWTLLPGDKVHVPMVTERQTATGHMLWGELCKQTLVRDTAQEESQL